MTAAPATAHDSKHRDPGSPPGRPRPHCGLLVALLVSLCAFAVPAAPAFAEGSAQMNTGPGGQIRQTLLVNGRPGGVYPVLYVYAQAGETVQLGSSAMGIAGGQDNILVYAPGTDLVGKELPEDPVFGTAIFDCNADDPGTGRIATRAEELAGPEPPAAGYTPCTFTPTTSGIYPVIMLPFDAETVVPGAGGVRGTVDAPVVDATQLWTINAWDITVRAGGAVQPGRTFTNNFVLGTGNGAGTSSGAEVFVYTKTGYEYDVNFTDQAGVNWQLFSDDLGVVDALTGDRLFASYIAGTGGGAGALSPFDRRYPLFVNRPDPLVISGAGGLGPTLGYSTTPIAPSTKPLVNAGFTGSGGRAGATTRGSGGTIAFTSPSQMAGLGYTMEIDLNGNGTFGDGPDISNDTNDLAATGNNGFAWSGLDAAGNAPACGSYSYRIRATLSEIHFAMADVENSGGTTIERLSLPTDPDLGDPFAASYNDIDPFQNLDATNNPVNAVTDGDSSAAGFHSWSADTGDEDWIDTWARLPEVSTSGTLRVLCPDVEIVKSSTAPLVAGERGTYRLTMINHGPGTAINARETDDLPSGVKFVSASDGCSQAAGVVTCTEPSLAEGASKTFTVTVDVDSSADSCEDVRNTATVTNDTGPDPEPSNNESTICNFEKRADLAITKTPSSATVAQGGQVMYTMVAKNNGPSDEPNAVVKDPIPDELTLVSAKPAQGRCSTAGNALECDLGSLKSGGSTQILVTATLSGTECVTNTARVSGDAFDTNLNNNEDDARVCPEGIDPKFDLVVEKTVNEKNPVVGETIRYRVVVTNRGPDAAPSATVKDVLNAPVTVVSVKASQGSCGKRIPMTCELGTIPAGGRVTITIRVKHLEPVVGDCSRRGQRNAASATADGTDTNPANNLDVAKVCPKVEIKLTKQVSTGTVSAGETFSYTIRTHNPSKVAVRNVRTCDSLPAGLVYVSSNPKAKLSKGQHCWTAKAIGAGKTKTYKVTVRALSGASGRLVNTATATSPSTKRVRGKRAVRVIGQAVEPPQPTG